MIAKVDAAIIALDQWVSHLKFLLECELHMRLLLPCLLVMFLVTVCLLKDSAFCEVFYAAEVI